MDTIWKSITTSGAKHWFLTSLLPAALFLIALLGLYVDVRDGWNDFWSYLHGLTIEQQSGVLLVSIILIVVGALTLDAISLDLLRWSAGYTSGDGLFQRLYEMRRNHYQGIVEKGNSDFNALIYKQKSGTAFPADLLHLQHLDEELHYYPIDSTKVMPTLIGNILRSTEEDVRQHYGLDPTITWVRLYPSLSETLRDALGENRAMFDLAVRLMFLAIIFAEIAVPLEVIYRGWPRGIAYFIVGLIMFFVSHRWAVQFAKVYGEFIRTAFDLHHFDLYQCLHLPPPRTSGEEEIRCGKQLTELLWRGLPDIPYEHPSENFKDKM